MKSEDDTLPCVLEVDTRLWLSFLFQLKKNAFIKQRAVFKRANTSVLDRDKRIVKNVPGFVENHQILLDQHRFYIACVQGRRQYARASPKNILELSPQQITEAKPTECAVSAAQGIAN